MFPSNLKYTRTHEWVQENEDRSYTVGITDHAAEQLGDVTFVELPKPGVRLAQGDTIGSIESVKAVSDLYAPVAGRVSAVNEELATRPELVNQSPYGEGWLVKLEEVDLDQFASLLDAAAYEAHIAESEQ